MAFRRIRIDQRRVLTDSFTQVAYFFAAALHFTSSDRILRVTGKQWLACPRAAQKSGPYRRPVSFHWQRWCHRQAQKYSK
jgi:hypothetical protein